MVGRIEFLGLPAAGKTTILRSLVPIADQQGLRLLVPLPPAASNDLERWQKIVRDTKSVIRLPCIAPIRAKDIWRACRYFEQPTIQAHLRMYLNCLRLEGLVDKYRGIAKFNDVIAFDQGLFQAIWSLTLCTDGGDPALYERGMARITEVMTKPDLVILVDTSAAEIHRRLQLEPAGHGRLPGLIKCDPRWLERAAVRLESIWNHCRREPGVKTFRLSAESFDAHMLVDLIRHSCQTTRIDSVSERI